MTKCGDKMKMYFYYGVMGSSKTATALMKKFSFEEKNRKVVLIKPSIDSRDGKTIVKSRIGLSCEAVTVAPNEKIKNAVANFATIDVIIVDEARFNRQRRNGDVLWAKNRLYGQIIRWQQAFN